MSKKWTVATVCAAKGNLKLGGVTAYDAAFARLADAAGVPLLLVGDSMGNNVLGYGNTLPVTIEDTLRATAAVARSVQNALVIADLPFGSYQCGDDRAVEHAVACLKCGADAVKLEGGVYHSNLIKRLVAAGIPVMGHVGMCPQSVNLYGGFKKQGKTRKDAARIFEDARAVVAAGAFAVTLECVPAELAAEITAAIPAVTVGIGAGPVCDGQWLVMHDLLGLNEQVPSFVKQYAHLADTVRTAFAAYVKDVSEGAFPTA